MRKLSENLGKSNIYLAGEEVFPTITFIPEYREVNFGPTTFPNLGSKTEEFCVFTPGKRSFSLR